MLDALLLPDRGSACKMECLESRLLYSAVAVGAAVLSPALSSAAGLNVQLGSKGISKLSYNGTVLFDQSVSPFDGFSVTDVFKNTGGVASTEWGLGKGSTSSWNASGQILTYTSDFGSVAVQYTISATAVEMAITVTNTTSNTTIEGLDIIPVALTFPQAVTWAEPDDTPVNFGPNGPGVVVANFGTGDVATVEEDTGRNITSGFLTGPTTPTKNWYETFVGSALPTGSATSWPSYVEPIAPNSSEVYHFALRFGPTTSTAATLAPDVLKAYAAANPSSVNWSDRRPIGILFPAGSNAASRSATNPRGWFNDPKVNVTTPAGLANFAQRLLAYANSSIQVLKSMDAQGMITWDIEGEQYANATYVGDPRVATTIAPELAYDNVVNQYFAAFRNAGLEVGVTLREQEFMWNNGNPYQLTLGAAAEAQNLEAKIAYAEQNWGCTLFYIDSNNWADSPAVLEQVHQQYPNVLLIPEHSNTGMYSVSAPFAQVRASVNLAASPILNETCSSAFKVIDTTVGNVGAVEPELVTDVEEGDILTVAGNYMSRANLLVKQIYQQAGKPLSKLAPIPAASTRPSTSIAPSVMPAMAAISAPPVFSSIPISDVLNSTTTLLGN